MRSPHACACNRYISDFGSGSVFVLECAISGWLVDRLDVTVWTQVRVMVGIGLTVRVRV